MAHDKHEGQRTVRRFALTGAGWGLFLGLVIGTIGGGDSFQAGDIPFADWMAVIAAVGLAGSIAGYLMAHAASPGGAGAVDGGHDGDGGDGGHGGGGDGGGD